MVWVKELNSRLANSNAGIIFLTPENQNEPWIQFEAGALAKGFSENRVFVLLIGLENSHVEGPLSNFNLSKSDEIGIKKLVFDLNNLLGENRIDTEILSKVFEKNYPDLQQNINEVLTQKISNKEPEKRSEDDIQSEMLGILRSLSTRISNVEHSITQNKGLIFTNKIPPAPELPAMEMYRNGYYKLIRGKGVWQELDNAEVGEDLTSSSSSGEGI